MKKQILAGVLMIGVFLGGYSLSPIEYVEVIKEVEVVVEVEVVKPLVEFKNVSELEEWLRSDNTDSGVYRVDVYDCDDFSETLVKAARRDGYEMWMYDMFVDRHFRVRTKINGIWWGIEPQTDEIFKLGEEI